MGEGGRRSLGRVKRPTRRLSHPWPWATLQTSTMRTRIRTRRQYSPYSRRQKGCSELIPKHSRWAPGPPMRRKSWARFSVPSPECNVASPLMTTGSPAADQRIIATRGWTVRLRTLEVKPTVV